MAEKGICIRRGFQKSPVIQQRYEQAFTERPWDLGKLNLRKIYGLASIFVKAILCVNYVLTTLLLGMMIDVFLSAPMLSSCKNMHVFKGFRS